MISPDATTPPADTVACAFVGLLDVEGRAGDNAAYSPAGTQFQECLLRALSGTALDVTHVYALRPVPSFPRDRRLFFGARHVVLVGSIKATLLGFVNLGPLKTFSSAIALLPRLLTWAWHERRRPRVIMQYNLSNPPGLVAVLAARLTRSHVIPIVADLQVPGAGLVANSRMRRIEFGLLRRTLPHCDGLIVLTRKMVDDFAPSTASLLVEGAVPDVLVAPVCEARAVREEHRPFVVMYSGGLSDLKGIPLLLAAFALLKDKEYALWITGRGPLESLVRDAAVRDPRVVYFGFPDQKDLLCLYSTADALVNPHSGTHESAKYLFPSKLIEYLATGVPVVTTCSTPEVAEIYGHVALLVRGDDAADLAAQIRQLSAATLSERSALGDKARSFVLAEKTWASQAKRIADFALRTVTARAGKTTSAEEQVGED